ncbi:MAG TPA: hypothetical protein VNC82_09355 [Candidatus Limnocylindria bacterium]|nr:hypothetical protein [Candidatus Limnocylindria bacterium]
MPRPSATEVREFTTIRTLLQGSWRPTPTQATSAPLLKFETR